MTPTGNNNINSPEYWDQIYLDEWGSGKRRIDHERLEFLIGGMRDWHQYHTNERGRLLDVGCGNGELLRLVHATLPEWEMNGIDITAKTIAKAQGCDPGFKYREGNIYDLPYGEEFPVVFCGETLEHLDHPEDAIKQLARVTLPGGYLICSLPCNHNNYSPEHQNEFTVWDAIKLTQPYGELINIDVKCGGLSTIWTIKKR